MKKSVKIILGVAGVLALIGVCFGCLSLYAKKEINKPKFELPEVIEEAPLSALPSTKEEAFDYVSALYEKTASANDVEGSWHTDIRLNGDGMQTAFSDSDNAVLSRVLENSQGGISALYPVGENVLMTEAEGAPELGFKKEDVTDFTARRGYEDESGELIDNGVYYITLTVNPDCIDVTSMAKSEIVKSVEKELSPVLTADGPVISAEEFTASFEIACYNDMLTRAEIKQNFKVKTAVTFTDGYKALGAESTELTIPYEKVQYIDFFSYGIHFTERQLAIQLGDIQALPLEVRVNAETASDDYKLSFNVSKDGLLEIDKDGVMTVTAAQEEPVTVTATLEYDGHTYSDELIVYATEWEVKTDEQSE